MATTSLARIVRLVRRLPAGGRLAWLGVAAGQALQRVGIVGGVLALTLGQRWPAVAIAGATGFAAVAAGAVRASLRRRSRVLVAHASVDAILRGWILGAAADEDLAATVHDGLVMGTELMAGASTAMLGDLLAVPVVVAILVTEVPARALAVGVLGAVAAAAVVVVLRSLVTPFVEKARAAFAPVYDDIAAAAAGRLDVVANGRDAELRETLATHLSAWQGAARRSETFIALAGRGPSVVAMLVVACAIALDASLRGSAEDTMVSAAALGASAAPLFLGMTRGVLDLQRSATALRPLFDLLEGPRAFRGNPGAPLPPVLAPIEWKDVSFVYPAAAGAPRPALSGVRVRWGGGQVLGVRGPNGSGKSTLFRLLLGLAQPTSGSVRVGDVDLLDLDLVAWRRRVAYLPQRPFVRERATLRETIRFLAPGAVDERMREALAAVGLSGLDCSGSSDPLDARVGTLSAGQRQRLALARTLCQDGAVVVLDEPDANLDVDGIAMVERLVSELRRDRMVALVAHTPRLLSLADVLVDLKGATGAESSPMGAAG